MSLLDAFLLDPVRVNVWIASFPISGAPMYPSWGQASGLVRDDGLARRPFAEALAWDNLMPKWLEVIRLARGERSIAQDKVLRPPSDHLSLDSRR